MMQEAPATPRRKKMSASARADVLAAWRHVADQKNLVLRVRDRDVVVVVPRTSHLAIGDFAAREPACLARALLALLARARLPPMDIVVNAGDLPASRLREGAAPFHSPADREARAPMPVPAGWHEGPGCGVGKVL